MSQAIAGLGGIGKTQTAVEYAYRYAQDERVYDGVFWVKAETAGTLVQDFGAIARLVGVPGAAGLKLEERVAAARAWLNQHGGWLLIFDNADDPNLLKGYRPTNALGRVLLTSRSQSFGVVGIGKALTLTKLEAGESERFLWERTGRVQPEGPTAEGVKAIARELDYLPLALEQAAAYIAAKQVSFAAYGTSYGRRRLVLLEQQCPETGDYPASVATTWLLNFEAVRSESLASAQVLELSGFLAADGIPDELLVLGRQELGEAIAAALAEVDEDPVLLAELLAPLARYSLIRLETEQRR